MEAWERDLLKTHYSFLLKSLDPETVRIALWSKDLLTPCEHDQIKAQTTPMAANEQILEALKRRAPGTLERFCMILEEEGGHANVVEKLKKGRSTFNTFTFGPGGPCTHVLNHLICPWIQWNLSTADTLGTAENVLISEVSSSQG